MMPRMKSRRRTNILAAARVVAGLVLLVMLNPIYAQTDRLTLEVTFIERLTRFITWPDEKDRDESSPFLIEVIGAHPFGSRLDELAQITPIKGRPVRVRYIGSAAEIGNGQVLFISASENGKLPLILAATKGLPVLTIGDTPGFGERGVMINFFLDADLLRFEINRNELEHGGLDISRRLLRGARLVVTGDGP